VDNSIATLAKFKNPTDVAIIGTDIYVADKLNLCIRKISAAGVSTLCGNPTMSGNSSGTLSTTKFEGPHGLASGGANLLMVTEPIQRRLRLIDIPNNVVSLLPPNNAVAFPFSQPYGVAYSDKRSGQFKVFVADAGNNTGIKGSSLQGDLTSIPLASMGQSYDLAFDATGNLFILDRGRNQIVVVYTDNTTEAIAGNMINGPAVFTSVSGLAINRTQKLLYVSDEVTNTITQIKFE